jgi:hypothetical protein
VVEGAVLAHEQDDVAQRCLRRPAQVDGRERER